MVCHRPTTLALQVVLMVAFSAGVVLAQEEMLLVQGGTRVRFEIDLLSQYGLWLSRTDDASAIDSGLAIGDFVLSAGSKLGVQSDGSGIALRDVDLRHNLANVLRSFSMRTEFDSFRVIVKSVKSSTTQFSNLSGPQRHEPALLLRNAVVRYEGSAGSLIISSDDVALSASWALALGVPRVAGKRLGAADVRARLVHMDGSPYTDGTTFGATLPSEDPVVKPSTTTGPDIIVGDLSAVANFGSLNGVSAFAVGTTSCNAGDEPALWIASTREHPVIAQNLYRLKNDRFEQIGMSWVKHGFAALAQNLCGIGCQNPGTSSLLGVGCSDPYGAGLNGDQNLLGPRSQVNAFTGFFTWPKDIDDANCTQCDKVDRRLQVADSDLDPALNQGALYFVEGHYVTADEASIGHHQNNASYRRARLREDITNCPNSGFGGLDPGEFCLEVTDTTQRERPAIGAWKDRDPSVVETNVQIPGEGLLILAAKVVGINNGTWRYEYAIQNINSDRSAGWFSVPLPQGAIIQGAGFHDVSYHSGEPFSTTDWEIIISSDAIRWRTVPSGVNTNANALRWGTLYNFWFEANVGPDATTVTIGLFKPGFPDTVPDIPTTGPAPGLVDCNNNLIADACDISCGPLGCESPCGMHSDCNGNGVPDDCEPDCNGNGLADECDIGAAQNTRPVSPLGDNDLQVVLANNVLDTPPGIYVSGPVYDAIADQSNQAVFTGAGSGGSVTTFIIENSVASSTNRLGLYDFADQSKKVELFDGGSGTGSQTIVSFLNDGTVQVFFEDSGVVGFSGNFGFYVDVYDAPLAGGGDDSSMTYDYTVYTEDGLNPGGAPQALLYQGNDLTTVMLPLFAPGIFSTNNWIIAFEDRLVGGSLAGTSDEDYSDLVIMVQSITPIGGDSDCNSNLVPDSCEVAVMDCNFNGIPDDCDGPLDCDGDGIDDCDDECRCSSQAEACVCPTQGRCCFPIGFCIDNFPRSSCLADGGTPDCIEAPCTKGCELGIMHDFDLDNDVDMRDCSAITRCFSGPMEDAEFVAPSFECLLRFDTEGDGDIDLIDLEQFRSAMSGP